MVESGEDEEQTTRDAFAALRRHVVRVSAEFGARLAVRLLAIAAGKDKHEPTLLAVFGSTMAEAVSIVLAPLTLGAAETGATAPEAKGEHDEST